MNTGNKPNFSWGILAVTTALLASGCQSEIGSKSDNHNTSDQQGVLTVTQAKSHDDSDSEEREERKENERWDKYVIQNAYQRRQSDCAEQENKHRCETANRRHQRSNYSNLQYVHGRQAITYRQNAK